jgi:uncharacterized iron-regulated membrane protein
VRKILFNLHLYAALFAGAFIVVLGVTGSILAFEPEIDRLLHWKFWHVTPQGRPLSIAGTGAAVSRAFHGERVYGYYVSTSPGLSYQAELQRGLVYLNQYTGQVLGVQESGMDFLGYVHQIHLRLLLRDDADTGKKIVSWAGVAMLFLLLSGVYLWWPYKRVTIERHESSKRFWFDVHAAAGIFSFVFLLLLTGTGLIIGFEHTTTPLLYQITGSQASHPPRAEITSPPGATPITPDQAFQVARAALPGAAPFYINVPEPREPYFVRLRYPEDLTPGGRSQVMIDPYTGKTIWAQGSRTAPAGARLVIANRAIHTGDIFGVPGKAVASLASLMAVVQVLSGALMWWRGRQMRRRANQKSYGAARIGSVRSSSASRS